MTVAFAEAVLGMSSLVLEVETVAGFLEGRLVVMLTAVVAVLLVGLVVAVVVGSVG